jgi:hypothetical protein
MLGNIPGRAFATFCLTKQQRISSYVERAWLWGDSTHTPSPPHRLASASHGQKGKWQGAHWLAHGTHPLGTEQREDRVWILRENRKQPGSRCIVSSLELLGILGSRLLLVRVIQRPTSATCSRTEAHHAFRQRKGLGLWTLLFHLHSQVLATEHRSLTNSTLGFSAGSKSTFTMVEFKTLWLRTDCYLAASQPQETAQWVAPTALSGLASMPLSDPKPKQSRGIYIPHCGDWPVCQCLHVTNLDKVF